MLYQLSYRGVSRAAQGPVERAVYSGVGRRCPPGFAPRAMAGRVFSRDIQNIGKPRLFRILVVVLAAGDDIGAGEPAVEIDVAAAGRAERARVLRRRPAADRAAAAGDWSSSGFVVLVRHRSRQPWQTARPITSGGGERSQARSRQAAATVLSQPKRIGKPSPDKSVTVSYSGRPTTLE